jgi:hypothetical protein
MVLSTGDLTVGDQRPEALKTIERQQARDAGVLGVVLLLGGAALACDEVRVDRDHDVARVHQPLDEQPVAGLDHDTHLGRIGFELGNLCDEGIDRLRAVLHPSNVDDAVTGPTQRDEVEILSPVDANSEHIASLQRGEVAGWTKARRRSDGPVLLGRHPCGRRASEALSRGRRLISVIVGQESEAFPEKDLKNGG